MSWIAEYDTQGREFPTCVHVTKTTGTMTHGVTYVPIEDGKAVRAENAKLRELVLDVMWTLRHAHGYFKNDTHEMLMTYVRGRDGKPTHVAHSLTCDEEEYEQRMAELGMEVES